MTYKVDWFVETPIIFCRLCWRLCYSVLWLYAVDTSEMLFI